MESTLNDREIAQIMDVHLGDDKRMKATSWDNEPRIDIRQWRGKPSKNGVSLPLMRYIVLRDIMEDITDKVKNIRDGDEGVFHKYHLGGNVYASVTSPYVGVSIRKWFMAGGDGDDKSKELLPGRGIFLKHREWMTLCDADDLITEFIPRIKDTVRCGDRMDHMNQLGWINCVECNPNREYMEYM